MADLASLSFAILSLILVVGLAIYSYLEFDKHKKDLNKEFNEVEANIEKEGTKRLSNITSVVDQVNKVNKDISSNVNSINSEIDTIDSNIEDINKKVYGIDGNLKNISTKVGKITSNKDSTKTNINGEVIVSEKLCVGKNNNVWCLKPTEDGNNLRIQRNNDKMGDNSGNIVMSHDGNIRLSKKWKNNKSVGWIYDDLIRSAKKKDVDKEFKKVNTKMLNDLNKKQDKNAKEVCIVNKDKDGNESKWCMRGDAKNLRFQRNGEKMGSNTGNVVMSHDGNIHLSKKWKNNKSVGFIYDDLIRSAKKKDVDNELQNFKDTTNDTIDNLNSRLDDINEYTKNMFDMQNKTTNTEA